MAGTGLKVQTASYQFRGGLVLPGERERSASGTILPVTLPEELVLPLQQHIGTPARPTVIPGQQVQRGERLAQASSGVSVDIHAPVSARVVAIEPRVIAHPGAVSVSSIVLEVIDQHSDSQDLPALDWQNCEIDALIDRIGSAGIAGMGGAGFPAQVKLGEGARASTRLLIINAVECEPFITCDDTLIRTRAQAVIEGAEILGRIVAAERIVIALEGDMDEARESLADIAPEVVELVSVPTIYPAGGEKQLIFALTGEQVPRGGLPIELGIVMHNVSTAVAVADAVTRGRALVERIVTVTGEVERPGNYLTPLGTPVQHLLDIAGVKDSTRTIMGGPMMGIKLTDTSVPITRVSNCVLVMDEPQQSEQRACIRCGQCVEVCPASLDAQGLYEFCRSADFDAAQDYHIFDCIECGLCAYVCPSHIPLVHHYRYAKSQIQRLDDEADRASDARQRHEQRSARIAEHGTHMAQAERAPKLRGGSALSQSQSRRDYIAESVARERARREKRDD